MFDYLSNIKTLITLRFLQPTEKNMNRVISNVYPPFEKNVIKNEWKWFLVSMLLNGVAIGTIVLYMRHEYLLKWAVLIGSITMVFQYLERIKDTFYSFAWQYSSVVQMHAKTSAVQWMIDAYSDLVSKNVDTRLIDWKQISLDWLHFTYKESQKETKTLQNISFTMGVGEKIALVGESGSGKSTFLSLLRGLYDVDAVQVDVDNKQYDNLHVLANNTSLIPQEPEIFEETMLYNIAVWTAATQEEVEEFAEMACFHEIAMWLPHGYETSIKEKWVNLSWGQKQRLALARGLLMSQDSDILLLDESTSSVDSINERKIYQNIRKEYPQKTIIAAIHKLHLLPMFDTIYVFDKGELIAHWSLQQLLAQWGKFAHMREEYNAQID